jgi:uncharacterized protein
MENAINWFEIPVTDFERAKKFYETIMGVIMIIPFEGMEYAMFPSDMQNGGIGGGIVKEDGYEPSQKGALVYLNGGEDLSIPLSKIEAVGGKIVRQKTSLGGNGFMAQFIDTEGNKIALHSMK